MNPKNYGLDKSQWSVPCPHHKLIQAADKLAKAVKEFDSQIHCYSIGVATLLEEDMKPKHKDLVDALAAYKKVRGK